MTNRACLDRVADELCEFETMTGERLKAAVWGTKKSRRSGQTSRKNPQKWQEYLLIPAKTM